MQSLDFIKKSKLVFSDVISNKFKYSEQAMFLIHLEAKRVHRRLVFKKKELDEVRDRLFKLYPAKSDDEIPDMLICALPPTLTDFMRQFSHDKDGIKVEWFYGGIYYYTANSAYKERIDVTRKGERQLYSKCVDTLAFSEYDIAFKMWLESIDRPGVVIKYDGLGFHRTKNMSVQQTARIMSLIVDASHAITMTVVQ